MKKGIYAFTTLNCIGANFKVTLKNDLYNDTYLYSPYISKGKKKSFPIKYKIKVFNSKGNLVSEFNEDEIQPDTYKVLNQADLVKPKELSNEEFLILVELTGEDFNIDSPEHQIEYNMENGKSTSFIVDHIPVFPNKKPSTIVFIGHKCFVSSEINTYVCFMPGRLDIEGEVPYELLLLAEDGTVLFKENGTHPINASKVVNIKALLKNIDINLDPKIQFFNLCFKIEGVSCVIYNVIHNEKSDNLAIEHSLPPYYYTSQKDLTEIRKNSFKGI